MWKLCGNVQHKKPEDFVISSGKTYSVKEFVNKAANMGFDLEWSGKGLKEKAMIKILKKQ